MSSADARLNAVIAALEQVRAHVDDMALDADVDAAVYNRWIAMLDGVVDGNWNNLTLPDEIITASEMLMHIDAAVAFLSTHREA